VNIKYIILFTFLLYLLSGCTQQVIKKQPYHYPNYSIIKPKVTCKAKRQNIKKLLTKHLNKPYVWAEEGPDAFDCSGLTYNIYGEMGIKIPRITTEQAKMGKRISFNDLYYGDLIFFGTTNKNSHRINHVGMYLRDGWFAHASSANRKVIITNFANEPSYYKRIKICRRYLSKNELYRYTSCEVPLKKMKITDSRYTTPWKRGMRLPRKAVP